MPFRDPLPLSELKILSQRHARGSDVHKLLWEVKRLHSLIFRMDQLARSSMPWTGTIETLWIEHKAKIADEPCIKESAKWRKELTDP